MYLANCMDESAGAGKGVEARSEERKAKKTHVGGIRNNGGITVVSLER